jgi:hypothetical protein|tara:strand:- start:1380 stop:1646 length:267 start_codon:yes stop_codon:yes gene_type:complete
MYKFRDFININEEKASVPPKLHRLLRLGLVKQDELETMRRALRQGDKALSNPLLRKKLIELLNKFIETVEDDSQVFLRLKNRILKGKR